MLALLGYPCVLWVVGGLMLLAIFPIIGGGGK